MFVESPLVVTEEFTQSSVNVSIFVSFHGHVAVPRLYSCDAVDADPEDQDDASRILDILRVSRDEEANFLRQLAQKPRMIADGPEKADIAKETPVDTEANLAVAEDPPPPEPPAGPLGKMNRRAHFEYPIHSYLDLARRYTQIKTTVEKITVKPPSGDEIWDLHRVSVKPKHNQLFIAWKGSMHYRVYATGEYKTCFIPVNFPPYRQRPSTGQLVTTDIPIHGMVAPTLLRNVYPTGTGGFITVPGVSGRFDFVIRGGAIQCAVERPFETYGDYHVPFQSEFNFLRRFAPQGESGTDIEQTTLGYFYVLTREGTRVELFSAAGDDMQFAGFNPIGLNNQVVSNAIQFSNLTSDFPTLPSVDA
jgi:hypothetical protein